MRELSKSSVCFFCGNSVSGNAASNNGLILEENVCVRWREECAVVLSGLLCTSGNTKDIKDILIAARYCSKCDVGVKDLCWTFQMMDKLRTRMAELVEEVVQNIFTHYEQLEVQSFTKRVTGNMRVLRDSIGDVIHDLEASGWQSKSQEEIRACIFYNLADIEFPQKNLKPVESELRKVNRKVKDVFTASEDSVDYVEDAEEVVLKGEPADPLEDNCDTEFVPEYPTNEGNDDDEDNEGEDYAGDDDHDDEFVPSENEADEDEDEGLGRFSKRRRLARENVSYAEGKDDDEEEEDSKEKTKKKKRIRKRVSNNNRVYRDPEKQRRSEAFKARCPVVCSVKECGRRFENEMMRDGHFEKMHNGNPKPFKCHLCDKCYPKAYILNIHIACVHNGKRRLPKNSIHKCEICSEMFSNAQCLECHIGAKHPKIVVNHLCDVCSKGFDTLDEVAAHKERIHVGETPFKCEDCGEVFPNSVNLRFHTKTVHPIDESAKCKICNRTVTSAAHLKVHTKKNHPELFGITYECQHCKQVFKTFYMLSHHQRRTHPEKMPGKSVFPCETCGEKFRRGEELKRHIRKHTGEKPYDCKMCDKKFRTVRDQKIHEQSHSGVSVMCDYCGKTFMNGSSFRKHLKLERTKAAKGESVAVRKPVDPNNKSKRKRKKKVEDGETGNTEVQESTDQLVAGSDLATEVNSNPEQPQDLSATVNIGSQSSQVIISDTCRIEGIEMT